MTETPDPNAMPGSAPTLAGPPPGSMGYPTPPAGPPKRSNRLAIGILAILAVVVIGGIAYVYFTRDSSSGGVDALQVGDCIDEPAGSDTITEVQHQPCNKPHDGEVFAVLTNPAPADEAYPVVSGFDDYIQTSCVPLWEAYTGRSWATDTELSLNFLHPTLSGWADGDRGFSCYLTRVDGQVLNASVKGIGASPLP